ncbi:MAG TPA: acetate--CoA ligase family protein [Burkholderiales bacterium]|nr:acetate--CoA ligase family protein [Burkholderiales bacterium]
MTERRPELPAFQRLFSPRGIAIVGASGDVTRTGGQTVRALNRSGFRGGIFPVNPKYREIDGRRCYANVSEIEEPCDLAVIALPAAHVPNAVHECGLRGIGYAIILGGGFRESGEEGARLEMQMLSSAREHGVRLIGPNCIGLVNAHEHVIAAFGSMARAPRLEPGPVSVAVQSGGFGMSVVIRAAIAGIGFRYVVATGSESDITTPELINAYVDDPGTKVILAYVEGVRDGRALMASLRRALAAGKPVVLWKGGKTAQGARAAQSHTGNLTSTYDVYRTAIRQCGALEVFESEQAVDFLRAFVAGRTPKGRNVAIVTNTGGSAVVFSDAADRARLELAPLGSETRTRLAAALPPLASTANPVDTMAGYPRPEHANDYRTALEAILRDPHIDQLCVLFGTIAGGTFELSARVLAEAARDSEKPVFGFTAIPETISNQGRDILRDARIPLFSTPSRAAHAMGLLADFAEARLRSSADQLAELAPLPELPPCAITLDEHESKAIIAAAGICVTRDVLLPINPAAGDLSGVSFPVALKLVSRDIAHKSDIGAVRLNVARDALIDVAGDIVARARKAAPNASLCGLLACEMVTDGIETIVGVNNDESFGPVVLFGLGGVFAEALKDVAFRIAPFGLDEARAMISELRGYALFEGARGRPSADLEALANTLVRVSALAWALRDRLAELDINPLLVRPRGRGVVAADALVVLR